MKFSNWFSINSQVLPLSSLFSLVVTWIGLLLFSTKLYQGLAIISDLSSDLFAFLIPWIAVFKTGLILLCIFMIAVTSFMMIIGFFATRHCRNAYVDDANEMKLGNRVTCGSFLILSNCLNIFWMGILSVLVVMTSAYVAFEPICLPNAGDHQELCFNFTLMSILMSQTNNMPVTKLILCGEHVHKFCRLTRGILPWFWGAYSGCIAVLMGLMHFNSCMAANFAHGKHAARYRKLWKRNKLEPAYSNRSKLLQVDEHGLTSTFEPEANAARYL